MQGDSPAGNTELADDLNRVTYEIIAAAIEVHRHLGPGLLESAYLECVCYELGQLGLAFVREVRWPLKYKGLQLDCNYRVDLLVEDAVVVELKSVEQLLPVHQAQLLTYLKASGKRVGLLINFNVPILKNGVRRLVNEYSEPLAGDAVSSPSHPQHADSQSGVSAGTIPPDRGYR